MLEKLTIEEVKNMISRGHFSKISARKAFGGLDLRTVVKTAASYLISLEHGGGSEAVVRIAEETGLSLEAVKVVVESRLLPKFLLRKIASKRKILSSNERKTVVPYLLLLAEGSNHDSAKREVARKLNRRPDIIEDQLKQTIRKVLSNLKFDSLSFDTYFP